MARNGSGVYSLPSGYAATSGNTATASQHNLPLEDIAADLNVARPISAGGTGATSATAAVNALSSGFSGLTSSLALSAGAEDVPLRISSSDVNAYLSLSDDTTTSDISTRIGAIGNNLTFTTGSTERMRLTNGTQVLFGKTSTSLGASGSAGVEAWTNGLIAATRSDAEAGYFDRLGSDGKAVSLRRQGVEVGTITVTAASAAYNTTSDPRSKNLEGAADYNAVLAALSGIDVYMGEYKLEPGVRRAFLLSTEIEAVAPHLVAGEAGATDDAGGPVYQQVDLPGTVPYAIAAIKGLHAKVKSLKYENEALEARITALESKQ